MARLFDDTQAPKRQDAAHDELPAEQVNHHDDEHGFAPLIIPDWLRPIWAVVRSLGVVLVSLLIVGGVVYTGITRIYSGYIAPVDTQSTQSIEFKVERGWSLSRISDALEESGLIRHSGVFKYYVDFSSRADKLQPGTYQFTKAMSMDDIVDQLTRGDGLPKTVDITVREGMTVDELAKALYRNGKIKNAFEFMKMSKDGTLFQQQYDPIAQIMGQELASERKYILEGYLFPDTYQIYVDSSNESIAKKMLARFINVYYTDDNLSKAEALGFTVDQVVTLASLIEKEGSPTDFTKLSAVFHNRMKADMRLESSASVRYALDDVQRIILTDKEKNTDSLYNTFRVKGLPLGPICNPSRRALEAALNPDPEFVQQNILYYVQTDPALTREVSTVAFAATKDEYNALVEQYRPLWQAHDQALVDEE